VGPIVIETERMLVREWTAEDIDDLLDAVSDPEVTRFLGTWNADLRRDVTDFVERQMAMQQGWGWCRWALELRDPAEAPRGVVGFSGPGCTFAPDIEVGWTLRRELWGRGLATEVARAVVDHCFGVIGFDRLISCIDPRNVTSLRVAEKVGFRPHDEIEHSGDTIIRHQLFNPLPDPPRDPRFRLSCDGAPMPRA
jgi:RimJ/RimL family protein N-acetyltransferase